MFGQPKHVRNSLSVAFLRQRDIRRRANDFEDILKGMYFQPHIIPIPDDLDPEVPRMVFGSEHGFSQIVFSQISLSLNVTYSPDWQFDAVRRRDYLLERAKVLFDLLGAMDVTTPHFCGLTTKVLIASKLKNDRTLKHLAKIFLKDTRLTNLHEIQNKTTIVVLERFFSNITVQNYRMWKTGQKEEGIRRLSHKDVIETGIQIFGDFNDRYMFNEKKRYSPTFEDVDTIIGHASSEIDKAIKRMLEGIA